MCLIVHKGKFKIEIAQEDIICYKVLFSTNDTTAISPYQGFEYKIGETYRIGKPLEIKKRIDFLNCINVFEIHEGFHSFLTLEDAKDEGVELFFSDDYFRCRFRCFRCVIPKGTIVVYGKYGKKDAVVSEEIKIIEEI